MKVYVRIGFNNKEKTFGKKTTATNWLQLFRIVALPSQLTHLVSEADSKVKPHGRMVAAFMVLADTILTSFTKIHSQLSSFTST